MTMAQAVLDVIAGYIGVAEDPPHSNRTIIGEKYGWNGVPWCAISVTVCQHEAGNTDFRGSASCSQLVGWYRDGTNGEWLGNPGADRLLPGDEFFLGSRGQDHTGLVEYVDGTTVHTIEGNWGDKVTRVARPVTAFYGFGRPNYAPATQGDDDMPLTQEDIDKIVDGVWSKAITYIDGSPQKAYDFMRFIADDAHGARAEHLRLVKSKGRDEVYITDMLHKRHLTTATALRHAKAALAAQGDDVEVEEWDPADVDAIPDVA